MLKGISTPPSQLNLDPKSVRLEQLQLPATTRWSRTTRPTGEQRLWIELELKAWALSTHPTGKASASILKGLLKPSQSFWPLYWKSSVWSWHVVQQTGSLPDVRASGMTGTQLGKHTPQRSKKSHLKEPGHLTHLPSSPFHCLPVISSPLERNSLILSDNCSLISYLYFFLKIKNINSWPNFSIINIVA